MHVEAYTFLASHAEPAKTVLDVGGRDINGSPRGLFTDAAYTALDVVDGPGVDIVADVATWESKKRFEVVICAEVLEHVEEWKHVVLACWKRVVGGGLLLLTCATEGRAPHSAVDGGPLRPQEHYGNVSGDDLANLLFGLTDDADVEAHLDRGDLYAWARKEKRKPRD